MWLQKLLAALQTVENKNMPSGIYKRTKETLEKLRKNIPSRKGVVLSEETKRKMQLIDRNYNKGDNSYNWKENEVGYRALHYWVRRWKGEPEMCEMCGSTTKKLHYANIDHKYRRVLDDYIVLCSKCHGEYDVLHGLRKHN